MSHKQETAKVKGSSGTITAEKGTETSHLGARAIKVMCDVGDKTSALLHAVPPTQGI